MRLLTWWLFFLTLGFTLWAMPARPPKDSTPSTPPPVKPATFRTIFPKQEWTDWALAAVQDAGLEFLKPLDATSFCPKGMSAHNWVHLLASMAKYESGFDPNQVYRESFGVNSIGLLQLSVSDKAYGCAFKAEADVKDPKKNIECAVKILKKWVPADEVISNSKNKGGARYWSVLRPTGKLSDVKVTLKPLCE